MSFVLALFHRHSAKFKDGKTQGIEDTAKRLFILATWPRNMSFTYSHQSSVIYLPAGHPVSCCPTERAHNRVHTDWSLGRKETNHSHTHTTHWDSEDTTPGATSCTYLLLAEQGLHTHSLPALSWRSGAAGLRHLGATPEACSPLE